jgi:CRISPR-associated protein Cas5t
MEGTKFTITGDMAHFKNSRSAVLQQTYKIPPISTVVGMLKNIYGEDIENFRFGYNFSYSNSQYEISTLYKEVNNFIPSDKSRIQKQKFITNPCNVEYLINPRLEIIVIGLQENYIMDTVLNLGKANCLAKLKYESVEITNEKSMQYNILTDFKDGDGIIERQNIETKYNEKKGCFDYYTKLIRVDDEYECQYLYDEQGLYLWKYNKVGEVECYKELI